MVTLLALVGVGMPVLAALVVVLLKRIGDAVDRIEQVTDRLEQGAQVVAEDLVVAKAKLEGVASDLEDKYARADVIDGAPGEAADAASRSGQVRGR